METFQITYEFVFRNGKKYVYPLKLNKRTISLVAEWKRPPPAWTRLEHFQCTVCPLTREKNPYCPIAANIAELVNDFREIHSTENVRISVYTSERTYMKVAPVQKGLSSIFGMIMATSNCPVMNFLKPMARYHLPFSTGEETIIRSVSMYLLTQYIVAKKSGQPDLSLENLERAYSMVQRVNRGICSRIATAIQERQGQGDAANNAIVILDTFSQLLQIAIEEKVDSVVTLFEGIASLG
jgi:hypothetical protein